MGPLYQPGLERGGHQGDKGGRPTFDMSDIGHGIPDLLVHQSIVLDEIIKIGNPTIEGLELIGSRQSCYLLERPKDVFHKLISFMLGWMENRS